MLVALLSGGCFDFDALRTANDLSGVADGGGDDASVGPFSFQASWPAHKSRYYGSHDVAPATLTFTYDADSVQCSHDNGTNWSACQTPNTMIFSPQDYNAGLVLAVKVSKAGYDDAVFTFNPSVELPGLHFYDCDDTVTADEPVEAFYGRLQAGRVICLASGVTITYQLFDAGMAPSTTGVFLDVINGNNLKVLGTESDRALFVNTRIGGNQGGFVAMSSALTGVVLSNLQIHVEDGNPISFEQGGGGNAFSYLDVKVLGGGNDTAVAIGDGINNTFFNVDIDASGSPSTPCLHVSGNAAVSVTGGKIVGRDDTTTVWLEGTTTAAAQLTGVQVENLLATSGTPKNPAVYAGAGMLTMSGGSVACLHDGIVIGGGGNPAVGSVSSVSVSAGTGVTVGYQSTATLAGLTLKTTGMGVIIDGAEVHLDNTLFERLDLPGAVGPALDLKNPNVLSSSMNGNHFCDQNLAGANKYSAALTLESGASNIGNFDLTKQVNMGVIDQCP